MRRLNSVWLLVLPLVICSYGATAGTPADSSKYRMCLINTVTHARVCDNLHTSYHGDGYYIVLKGSRGDVLGMDKLSSRKCQDEAGSAYYAFQKVKDGKVSTLGCDAFHHIHGS